MKSSFFQHEIATSCVGATFFIRVVKKGAPGPAGIVWRLKSHVKRETTTIITIAIIMLPIITVIIIVIVIRINMIMITIVINLQILVQTNTTNNVGSVFLSSVLKFLNKLLKAQVNILNVDVRFGGFGARGFPVPGGDRGIPGPGAGELSGWLITNFRS